jgi:hypothetical protein
MRFLDMSPYRPYRDMGQSCRTRPIRDKVVRWARPESRESREGSFVGRVLARADCAAAAELWRQAYPEVYGSSHNFMLFPEDYEDRMALAETWEEDSITKPHCMLVIEEKATGRLAAASLMTKFDHNLQIEWTFAGTHPDYRQMGLMGLLGSMMEWVSRASGAEYLTTFLETWHTITQAETLKREMGWRLAGIFPGNFTRWTKGQEEYRACEVHMYRFINDGEKYATRPEEWHLHPGLQQLWEALEAFNRGLAGSEEEKG